MSQHKTILEKEFDYTFESATRRCNIVIAKHDTIHGWYKELTQRLVEIASSIDETSDAKSRIRFTTEADVIIGFFKDANNRTHPIILKS